MRFLNHKIILTELLKENPKEVSFTDWMMKKEDFENTMILINKKELIAILFKENESQYEFMILDPKFKYTYTEEQLINLDVVNLIFSINEFEKNNHKLSKYCMKAIKDIQLKGLCEDLIEKIQY